MWLGVKIISANWAFGILEVVRHSRKDWSEVAIEKELREQSKSKSTRSCSVE